MSDRDDLAELLGSLLVSQQQNQDWYVSRSSGDTLCLDGWFDPKALAGAVLDAGLRPPARSIGTAKELDALPIGSLVMDSPYPEGEVYQRTSDGYWAEPGFHGVCTTRALSLPVTVLWQPEQEAGE
jgi:hypothetical protein